MSLCIAACGLTPDTAHETQVKRQHTFREQGRHDIATSLVLNHKPAQARMQLTGMIHGGPDRAFKAVLLHDSLLVRSQCKHMLHKSPRSHHS